jgi:hypothetical protein
MSAWIQLIVIRMIFLFLPSMAVTALILILTPFFVIADVVPGSPVRTLLF